MFYRQRKNARWFYAFLIQASLSLFNNAIADEEILKWAVNGDGTASAQDSALQQLTGQTTSNNYVFGYAFRVDWPNATIQADGRKSLRVKMTVNLTTGHTMRIGDTTPYPGVITRIHDASGTLTNLDSDYKAEIRLSERGNWIGAFVHSESRGPSHLAFELPVSLYDVSTGELIAQNNLIVGFDLTDNRQIRVRSAFFSPTPFADLRLRTSDIGLVMQSQGRSGPLRNSSIAEAYDGRATKTTLASISDRAHAQDFFAPDSVSRFAACSGDDYLELELHSDGFAQHGLAQSPPFNLRLRVAPSMIADGNIAYLDPVAGYISFHYDRSERQVAIGPGNHDRVVSMVSSIENGLDFDLGIALREQSGLPILARLQISCTTQPSGEVQCKELKLATAVDSNGRVISPRRLAELFRTTVSESYLYSAAIGQ